MAGEVNHCPRPDPLTTPRATTRNLVHIMRTHIDIIVLSNLAINPDACVATSVNLGVFAEGG